MIDIRTFMLVLAIGNIGFAMLMAGYARNAAGNPALRAWKWAKLVQGVAHLCGWLRPDFPSFGIAVAANLLIIVGVALEVAAYCTFFGFQSWKRFLYPFTALALLIMYSARLFGATGAELTIMMSVIIAMFTGAMSAILLGPSRHSSLLRRLIGVNDLIFFVAMSLRAYTGFTCSGFSLFTPSAVQSFSYLTGYLLLIVNGFGFLLLCKEKDDRKMQRLATIDSLTGLVNRRAFFERTDSARAHSARINRPIALMMIDIDHFKRLNDRFGHASGDEALCVFAATTQTILREHDVMGRLGGEEFGLVMPGTDLKGALLVAERLRAAVEQAPLPTSGYAYNMTVSIGLVVIDKDEHINAAMARADHALYAAKSAGRNRIEVGDLRLRSA
ncbi:MAG: GGDEF domain-containing protein [Massilia sp.]